MSIGKRLFLVATLLFVPACQSTGEKSTVVERVAIQYAVLKIAEKHPQRIERIRAIAQEAKTFLNGPETTLALLEMEVRGRIDFTKLDAADVYLVNALLSEVGVQLSQRVGEGVLSADALVQVNEVLDWIISAT